jgi:hypothetical protein
MSDSPLSPLSFTWNCCRSNGGRYAWTLVGLQALRMRHDAASPEFKAAQAATLAAAAHIDKQLAARHGDR